MQKALTEFIGTFFLVLTVGWTRSAPDRASLPPSPSGLC